MTADQVFSLANMAALVGWIIGQLADAVVRENIETHYRRQIDQLKLPKED